MVLPQKQQAAWQAQQQVQLSARQLQVL